MTLCLAYCAYPIPTTATYHSQPYLPTRRLNAELLLTKWIKPNFPCSLTKQ